MLFRLALYILIAYLLYRYFLKPLLVQKDPDDKETRIHKKGDRGSKYGDEGEYIDYEEVE